MTRLHPNRRAWGGFVTVGTVLGLVAALAITLFGTGAADHAIASFDASSWLWSSTKGEVARVNGVTGRVDTRYQVTDGQGHTMQVTQNDRYVVLRDVNTGKISVLDLSSLKIGSSAQTTSGPGITVALHNDTAFIIDSTQGLVRQLDPATLAPIGQAIAFGPGIQGGSFDARGRLWLLVPSEGTAVAVQPARLGAPASSRGSASAGGHSAGGHGGGGGGPTVVKTVAVADARHDLVLSTLDTGVAVLDQTANTLTTVRGEEQRTVKLEDLSGPGVLPSRTVGADVPVTVVDDRHIYVVNGDRVAEHAVPGESPKLQPCVAWSGRFYCADDATGTVYVVDPKAGKGEPIAPITVPHPGGPLELEVREDRLFINAPGASTARVVDGKNRVKVVDKYANDVLGGDPPPAPPAPPPAPRKPPVGPPGPPGKVAAVAGNAQATVTWGPAPPNGAAVTRYVIEGDATPHEVGANQRSVVLTGLTNGKEYRFSVHAVNAKGPGPKRVANPVIPTSEVPDPPTAVTAKENPDGTVSVTWPPANGQGRPIIRYEVTPYVAGAPDPALPTTAAELVIKPGTLKYGTQYAFKVVSINDKGAASVPSPLSNTVVPFTRPDAVKNLKVATVANKQGTVSVAWNPAEANGRAITRYEVTANTRKQDVTGANGITLNGFGDGESVAVTVAAVNEAGAGPEAKATAQTIKAPTIAVTGATGGTNNITVNFTADDGGGTPAACLLQVTGAGNAQGSCTSLSVGGLWPGNSYGYTVTLTNAAGMAASATGTVNTAPVIGTVICNDLSKCGHNSPGKGIWIYTTPSQNGTSVGEVSSPETYEARCQINTGTSINAATSIGGGGRVSAAWVKIRYKGENYIPYAWFNVNLGALPTC
ncbi:MAG TPA: fibronectin type III domain-containing protein [Micromonosporaceae bacterium]|nr:fibronectin type III domain-containing protein [Micromonosporaceae bacterium]